MVVKPDSVRSVERAIDLLFRVAAHDGSGAGVVELAGEIGCSKSTTHRLLGTLQRLEVVAQDPTSRRYGPGPRLRQLVVSYQDLRAVALPLMRSLRDETRETVTLHELRGDSHVVVEQCESPLEIRRISPIGVPIPLLTGATARVLLAFMPPEEAAATIERTRSAGLAGPSQSDLGAIREQGCSLSPSERLDGGVVMSAPLFDGSGQLIGALSVSGPRFRFTLARARKHVPALLAAARRISEALQ